MDDPELSLPITMEWVCELGFIQQVYRYNTPTCGNRFNLGDLELCQYKPLNAWHFADQHTRLPLTRQDVLERMKACSIEHS